MLGIIVLAGGDEDTVPSPARPSASATGWQEYHGVRLPLSAADGPRATGDDLASGFARTQPGALLAVLHIAVRANAQWGPAVFDPTITRQVIGTDQQALMTATHDLYERSRTEAGLPPGSSLGDVYVVYEAYRWQSYTPDAATVDIVSAGPTPSGGTVRASTRIQVRWQDGDWRVVAPLGGDWGNTATQVTSLEGYTRLDVGMRG
ncbi:hypothetical protein [Nonomuraea sp. NPDC046570]|uniref:hypothetical protein n=1 Tax=Nonomuraea sp. NPDC046570 TaxID=3155255 RepID=UPI003401F5EF